MGCNLSCGGFWPEDEKRFVRGGGGFLPKTFDTDRMRNQGISYIHMHRKSVMDD